MPSLAAAAGAAPSSGPTPAPTTRWSTVAMRAKYGVPGTSSSNQAVPENTTGTGVSAARAEALPRFSFAALEHDHDRGDRVAGPTRAASSRPSMMSRPMSRQLRQVVLRNRPTGELRDLADQQRTGPARCPGPGSGAPPAGRGCRAAAHAGGERPRRRPYLKVGDPPHQLAVGSQQPEREQRQHADRNGGSATTQVMRRAPPAEAGGAVAARGLVLRAGAAALRPQEEGFVSQRTIRRCSDRHDRSRCSPCCSTPGAWAARSVATATEILAAVGHAVEVVGVPLARVAMST